jgi:hypothetical protein
MRGTNSAFSARASHDSKVAPFLHDGAVQDPRRTFVYRLYDYDASRRKFPIAATMRCGEIVPRGENAGPERELGPSDADRHVSITPTSTK